MPVKHTNPNTGESEVHRGKKGEHTKCGIDTTKHSSHWVDTDEDVTCDRRGCKY